MKNGILYNVFKLVIEGIKYLSLVEFFKFISIKIWGRGQLPRMDMASRYAVDIFIITKWTLLLFAIFQQWNNQYFTAIIWYLIITNIHTYFYYHVWHKSTMKMDTFLIDRVRRRFLFLLLSIGFSNLAFAYLYEFPYRDNLQITNDGMTNHLDFLFFSFANSITADYENVKAADSLGQKLFSFQQFLSFVFFTIILAKSIPTTDSQV